MEESLSRTDSRISGVSVEKATNVRNSLSMALHSNHYPLVIVKFRGKIIHYNNLSGYHWFQSLKSMLTSKKVISIQQWHES